MILRTAKESVIFDAFSSKSESCYIWLDNLEYENTNDEESLRKIVEETSVSK